MQIKGTFITNLPITEGEGSNGHWMRGGFVIEYGDEYRHTLAFSTFNDKVELSAGIQQGQRVEVSFSPESREYNGRWYSECKCYGINVLQ